MRINGSDVDGAALRQRLQLAADAEDAAVYEALGIQAESEPAEPADPAPAPAGTPQLPEGMVVIDQAALAELQTGAQAGVAVAARLATEDRDRIILAAINDGKFPVSRREHYETMWGRDQEGTRTLLTASVEQGGLAKGLVPTRGVETGRAGDGEHEPGQVDQEHDAFMARHYPTVRARLRGDDRRSVRTRQEA